MMLPLSDLPIVDLVRTSFSIMGHPVRITKVASMVTNSRRNRATYSMDTRGELGPLREAFLLHLDMGRMDKVLLEGECSQPMLLVNFARISATTSFSAI